VEATKAVSEIAVDRFDAIMVAGGQAPMFTFEKASSLHQKFAAFYEAGKVACALCHGVAILRYAKTRDGQHIAKGKTVTGFANVEEDFADNAVWSMNLLARDEHVMPWRIEDEVKKLGANYVQAGLWRGFAIRDGTCSRASRTSRAGRRHGPSSKPLASKAAHARRGRGERQGTEGVKDNPQLDNLSSPIDCGVSNP
jgi:putative intracellular protease/amidase